MEGYKLLSNAYHPNVYRIERGFTYKKFPRELPGVLRGVMEEGEYAGYLSRIEEAEHAPFTNILVIGFIIFAFMILILMSVTLFSGQTAMITVIVISLLFCAGSVYFFIYTRQQKAKGATSRVEAITTEINQRYFARGIRWTYVPVTGDNQSYIEVVFSKTNSVQSGLSNPSAPTSYSSISSTSNTDSFNVMSPSYIPSAPPPPTTSTQSYSSGHYTSTIIAPEESFVPSYPGDPTMFTVVY